MAAHGLRLRRLGDLLGIVVVLGAALAVLAPALAHGSSLGPYDLLAQTGLTKQPGVVPHNTAVNDHILQMIPWTTLDWTQVHHGSLPLWNPYTALGSPLAFNWLSAPFGLATAVGYLFPMHLAYTVAVIATLMIAGSGMYVLARVLGMSPIGAVVAGTTFELSGSFFGWLGWPVASVMAFSGWLFAATLWMVHARRRAVPIVACAAVLALAFAAGQPQTVFLLGATWVGFTLLVVALRRRRGDMPGSALGPAVGVVVAGVAGCLLAAPLLLPGAQVASSSYHLGQAGDKALPPHVLFSLFTQSFDGLPLKGSDWWNIFVNYDETAAYLGPIALVLAVVAVLRRRAPEVTAFAVVAVVSAALVFVPPVVWLADRLPLAGKAQWHRLLVVLAFAVAVLAGYGIETVLRWRQDRDVPGLLLRCFGLAAIAVAGMWLFGRGNLRPFDASIRDRSFIWPTVQIAVGLTAAGLLMVSSRRAARSTAPPRVGATRLAAGGLVVGQLTFLLAAGMPLWASTSSPGRADTTAQATLDRMVGSQLVGSGTRYCQPVLGVRANANILFGLHELAEYDPSVPRAYFSSWRAATGAYAGLAGGFLPFFCPQVATARDGRRFGVAYVLTAHGAPGPGGAEFVRRISDEDLYRIPGAAWATLTPLDPGGVTPSPDAMAAPVTVRHPDPAEWELTTTSRRSSVLRLRLTAAPGWRATIDGRPLALHQFSGIMLQAKVPAGRHLVDLRYWPTAFTVGLLMGAVTVVVCLAVVLTALRSRRTTWLPARNRQS